MGSLVVYKTIRTFLSQDMRPEDAYGWATEMQSSGCAAVHQWPTLSFTHWTCKFDLDSEFISQQKEMGPSPEGLAPPEVVPRGLKVALALIK